MPLYFAYGANMDRDAMRRRCPRSVPLGVARLARHRIVVMDSGFASVVRDPAFEVHGVLFDLAFADIRALDRYEEVAQNLYGKVLQPVLRPDRGAVRALVYVGTSRAPGHPAPAYWAGVTEAAAAWDLPAAYRAQLERLGTGAAAPAGARRAIKLKGL